MSPSTNLHVHATVVKERPELLRYESSARDVIRRFPPRIFLPDFAFQVTSHHIVRVVKTFIPNTTIVDGHLKGKKAERPHSWLLTKHPDFILDVFPYGIGLEPHLVFIGEEAPWGIVYDTGRIPERISAPGFADEVAELESLLATANSFNAYP